MTDLEIQELKSRAGKSIYKSFVRSRSKEDSSGGFRGPCPIHKGKDKTAFSVFKKGGAWMWHCHTECNEGGDVIKFVRKLNDVEFPAALTQIQELLDGRTAPAEPETAEAAESDTPEPWPEWLPWYPTGWQPITQATRDAIAAKRVDHTPGLQAMRDGGVVEAKGKFVAFPCIVSGEVRNLRVLDFTRPKDDWQFWQFRPGPLPGTKICPDTSVLFSPFDLLNIDIFEPVYIVEGQWDCLTMMESGFQTVGLLSAGQPTVSKDALKVLVNAVTVHLN